MEYPKTRLLGTPEAGNHVATGVRVGVMQESRLLVELNEIVDVSTARGVDNLLIISYT